MRGALVMLLATCRALRPALPPVRRRSVAALATMSDAPPRLKVKAIVEAESPETLIGQTVTIKGWARTVRAQKALGFVEVNDGSSFGGLQVVFEGDLCSQLKGVGTGCAVSIEGEVVKGGGKQPIELKATSFELVGGCASDYPLQKKRHSLEFLRSIAHLRPRTNTLAAASRIRSTLAQAVHAFFAEEGFNYVHSPIITTSDAEGAGEMFRVTSLEGKELASSATTEEFDDDFFARSAYLTVSGQLSGEAYACALGDVYTFGPTFRAENSQTARHLAEFWMIEPEIAFADAGGAMDNAEAMMKYVIKKALTDCRKDLEFCDQFYGKKELINRLTSISGKEPFLRLSYTDAVALLQKEIAKDPAKWQFPDVEFGTDLATEHERWLAEEHAGNKCVFVYDYPRSIKSFYMRDNDDGKTVAAFDLLAPGVGELVGGSQREEGLDRLTAKMTEFGLYPADYWWYLDLRKYGSVPHAGYGLGFDRLVCYVAAIENIRDSIPFPRYPGSAQF